MNHYNTENSRKGRNSFVGLEFENIATENNSKIEEMLRLERLGIEFVKGDDDW